MAYRFGFGHKSSDSNDDGQIVIGGRTAFGRVLTGHVAIVGAPSRRLRLWRWRRPRGRRPASADAWTRGMSRMQRLTLFLLSRLGRSLDEKRQRRQRRHSTTTTTAAAVPPL